MPGLIEVANRDHPLYTKATEGDIKALSYLCMASAVYLELIRFRGKVSCQGVSGLERDYLVSASAAGIAERLGCTQKQVYKALETLKKPRFVAEGDGLPRSLITPIEGLNGRRGKMAVYLSDVPQWASAIKSLDGRSEYSYIKEASAIKGLARPSHVRTGGTKSLSSYLGQ